MILDIAFTGPRKLTTHEEKRIYKEISGNFITKSNSYWYVGDAEGLDNFIVRAAGYYKKPLKKFEVEGHEKWHFVNRSKRMIEAIAESDKPLLVAFPNKSCPTGCKPCKNPNGEGSGTWLTIAYAVYKGIPLYIFPLEYSIDIPSWISEAGGKTAAKQTEPQQMKLF
ncbi:hypothetical protein Cylst_5245 [Cylindrospermum stagnale PCC 7417]|uniref:Uncharacterized protein n=1 Tax=Cylindrospermum stagnale PCC 7417 TaxID=56107 RepID=K9X488_9NOST|nr:hypothetical protein [Cylindrospermum stagnale]AFZ27278.1 hypothetical protein Cylst_5245 [Cylindrospermum stagnale PCC 7417]